jgi:hypothetical protein
MPINYFKRIATHVEMYIKRLSFGDIKDDYLDPAHHHRSFDSMSAILAWLLHLARSEFPEFCLKDCNALEIGTGTFLSHAIGLYISGCRQIVSIDKFRHVNPDAVRLAMSNNTLARRFFSLNATHDEYTAKLHAVTQTNYEMAQLEALGIKYRAPFDLCETDEYKNNFDLVFSYTVFEHILPQTVDLLLEKSIDALKPGGYCIHFIDLEDHLDAKHAPFAFLSSESEWRDDDCITRGNRWRFSVWQQHLRRFADMEWYFPYIAVRNDASLPMDIDDNISYVNADDLRTAAFVAVGKKL